MGYLEGKRGKNAILGKSVVQKMRWIKALAKSSASVKMVVFDKILWRVDGIHSDLFVI